LVKSQKLKTTARRAIKTPKPVSQSRSSVYLQSQLKKTYLFNRDY